MLMAVEILQSDWTAILLQQNKSGYRAGTQPSVFREGRVTPHYVCMCGLRLRMSISAHACSGTEECGYILGMSVCTYICVTDNIA